MLEWDKGNASRCKRVTTLSLVFIPSSCRTLVAQPIELQMQLQEWFLENLDLALVMHVYYVFLGRVGSSFPVFKLKWRMCDTLNYGTCQ